jgi:hypothetical protein
MGEPTFAFNDEARVESARIGRSKTNICRIDAVLRDPQGVVASGLTQTYGADRSNLYPGMRAPLPEGFSIRLRAWLTPLLQRNGVLDPGQAIQRDASFFSVVTTASKDLLPIQCIPHYDAADPDLLAMVIYLCDESFSGTSFYRHRRTGYEEITAVNQKNYQIALDHDMRTHGAPKQEYANGDSLLFEVVFSNALRFNSAIVYPGRALHAADIPRQFNPPRDKSEWRLTITSLLTCRASVAPRAGA